MVKTYFEGYAPVHAIGAGCLVRSRDFGFIILVSHLKNGRRLAGTVVSSEGSNSYSTGYFSEDWNKEDFERVYGKLTIED